MGIQSAVKRQCMKCHRGTLEPTEISEESIGKSKENVMEDCIIAKDPFKGEGL